MKYTNKKNITVLLFFLIISSLYSQNNYPKFQKKFDEYGWSKEGINEVTGTKFNIYGWSKDGINEVTGTRYNKDGWNIFGKNIKTKSYYDENNFRIDGIHKETKTLYDKNGRDFKGRKKGDYIIDESQWNKNNINIITGTKFDYYGWSKEGINEVTGTKFNIYGWSREGIHKITGTKYNPENWDIVGRNKKTGTFYDENGFRLDQQDNLKKKTNSIKKISFSTESLLSNGNFENNSYTNFGGKYSNDDFIKSQFEYSVENKLVNYSFFSGKRYEGKFYKNEKTLDENFIGTKLKKNFLNSSIGSSVVVSKGKLTGNYDNQGNYNVDNNGNNNSKLRIILDGYSSKGTYFLGSYLGKDIIFKRNNIYEDGFFNFIEIGKIIPLKLNHKIIFSINNYLENYETYSFYESGATLSYNFGYKKGYIKPYIKNIIKREQNYSNKIYNFEINFMDKYQLGISGKQAVNAQLDLNYGIFWQKEKRGYFVNVNKKDTFVGFFLNLDYYLN